MVVSVDFDGTCVTHEFPEVGDNIGAEIVLKKLVDNGHKLILLTMRSKEQNIAKGGKCTLDEAVQWFKDHDLHLYGINENPSQEDWSKSRKVYANIYIDDQFLGCPKISHAGKHFVNWYKAAELLKGFLSESDIADVQGELVKQYSKIYTHNVS